MTPSLLLRPVAESDLPDLLRLAAASADGISSLPHDADKLRRRIQASQQAFASQDDASGEETYLFVLEDLAAAGADGTAAPDGGRIVGCSGITASAGFVDRFYSYRNEFMVHASPALGVSRRMHTLHLCHDLTGATLLSSFYLEPAYEAGPAAQLLSRARLLFILAHAERFSDRIAAECPGLTDEQGHSPFWNAVGRQFFGMDYPQAEAVIGGRSRSVIADLMPPSPVYVTLLPAPAQWAIGQLHPVGELPFAILQEEGFDMDTYVDIFDGGPTVHAPLHSLRSVRLARSWTPGLSTPAGLPVGPQLIVQASRQGFAATLASLDGLMQAGAWRQRLGAGSSEPLWITPLASPLGLTEEVLA